MSNTRLSTKTKGKTSFSRDMDAIPSRKIDAHLIAKSHCNDVKIKIGVDVKIVKLVFLLF